MSGAAVHAAEHAAVEGEKKPPAPAVVENNPAVGEDKKLAREEDRKPEGQAGGTHINFAKEQIASARSTLDGQQLQQLIKFDILEWWEMHSPKYPVLSRIARDVLAIQASTVASESSFSAGGRIISDHRNRLKSDMVEALICLQDWLNASDPKPTNKDVEEEEYLVFYQGSECLEETAVPHNQSTTSRSSPNCATGSVACRSQTE